MAHRLNVSSVYNQPWANFYHSLDFDLVNESFVWARLKEEYKAENVYGTPYIEFETEEDAIVFLLKWSW